MIDRLKFETSREDIAALREQLASAHSERDVLRAELQEVRQVLEAHAKEVTSKSVGV